MDKFISNRGEIKTYQEWEAWAISAFKEIYQNEYKGLPHNWFERIQKALRLRVYYH